MGDAVRSVTRRQAVAYRLWANNLVDRLPAGAYVEAARFALQDSAPRSALLSLHARVEACEPDAWADPRLIQTYSPRAAVHVLPVADFGVFTIGRLPGDAQARRAVEDAADKVCRALGGLELRAGGLPDLRMACASGRIAVRWTTSALYVREVPRPEVGFGAARAELCRRHVHAFGPTTPDAFAWWSGIGPADARQTWRALQNDLLAVDLEGHRAWILAVDEPALRSVAPVRGVRLLPAEDLRLLGRGRAGLFVGPGPPPDRPPFDTFHPHGLLVDGELVGAWGRRGGRVTVRLGRPLPDRIRMAAEAEALAFPIPGATMRVEIAAG